MPSGILELYVYSLNTLKSMIISYYCLGLLNTLFNINKILLKIYSYS